MPQVERSFISTPSGRVHIAASGGGAPVLLLHQTPRSWDEFRDVLPLLGRHYRAIAMDTMGYGDSDPLPHGQASIENWAKAAHELLVRSISSVPPSSVITPALRSRSKSPPAIPDRWRPWFVRKPLCRRGAARRSEDAPARRRR